MVQFVQQYWLEVAFGGMVVAMKYLYNKLKAYKDEQTSLKCGMMSLLHNEIYRECQSHLKDKCCSIDSRDNLEYLYKAYKKLGGNGTGEDLYKRCMNLPYEKEE